VATIRLATANLMPKANVDALRGTYLYKPHYDRVVRETATVLKPDGAILFIYVKDVLPRDLCDDAFATVRHLRFGTTDVRGAVAGGTPFQRARRDGTLTAMFRGRPMRSQVLGFLGRDPRNRYCRLTGFTRHNYSAFEELHHLFVEVNRIFREFAPDRWRAQHEYIQCIEPAFVIPGTVFTSVTLNHTERTAAHTDAHNYRLGLGVMAVLESECYYGAELIFPRYRIAVDMRAGGVCLADVNEVHGNAPLVGDNCVRFSFVFYCRNGMHQCGTMEEEERERADP
jgi:hypothetical protein